MEDEKTILSIQSHVTHGYVGNKAATFPLQLHGFDVDAINTVSLSNHSGYPIIKGHRMDLAEYLSLLEGLRANDFLKGYRYVLTGYINNADIIHHVEETVAEIRALRKQHNLRDVTYICDPVMGDNGKLYCKEEVITAYRSILHLADVATPNYFEASVLSGITICDMDSAIQAADWFHAQGTACVVIKSFRVKEDLENMKFLVSCAERQEGTTSVDASSPRKRYTGKIPFHDGLYTGTGDVFAACLLAFYHNNPIDVAVGKAMDVLQELIVATRKQGGVGSSSLSARELRVTSRPDCLLNPTHVVTAHLL